MVELATELDAFQPESLVAYASMARLLADEQLAGRLHIAPRAVMSASEVLTTDARRKIRAAWNVEPFDVYAATETADVASECERHAGLHVYEDLIITEIVDEQNRPVAPGVYGAKVLVTVLFARTLPLIRYEMSDSLALAETPCPCGRVFRTVLPPRGRREDELELPGLRGGREVWRAQCIGQRSMSPYRSAVSLVALLAGCAARTPGAEPHDMSIARHETMAAQEERAARKHEHLYDDDARERRERCRGGRATSESDACWTAVTNPTGEHLKEAEESRRRAADHRAASQTLRDAESQACRGVPAADRDESPFDRREDIERVDPLTVRQGGKQPTERLEGATVVFRALPGLTTQWLQRVVDCHLARNAALGHDAREMPSCPLVPKGVRATVTPKATGFAVELRADDAETASEILRRAKSLTTGRGAAEGHSR